LEGQELFRRLFRASRPELGRLFQLMAREGARHAGFPSRAQVTGRYRHGDRFNKQIRCWPELRQGLRSRLLSRFFLWSVFLTHRLTVCERGSFYTLLSIFSVRFDADVMRQTGRTARRAFTDVFTFEAIRNVELRVPLADTFRQIQALGEQPATPGRFLQNQGLKLRFAGLLVRQFCQLIEATGVKVEGTA
jgi:magnesium-protoporphyrin IX monomethyl ester (oxidative) cyclase